MSSSSRIPPLLKPHTRLPQQDSIFLLTSTLGASANWLIIRFLCEALSDAAGTKTVEDGGQAAEGKEPMAVVLVSWMRDWACDPSIGYTSLCALILRLHTLASYTIVHLPADDALISPSDPPQPLEIDAHNLLVKMAHMSTRILSCRVLDTGVAKDVSGVLRVTQNNARIQVGFEEQVTADEENRGAELLYLVRGDGAVRLFERGAGGDA
ncbi:hypothetical protein K491DRAFT_203660 [Lophiostoma macrostomum CBS 122681]|uniref:Uncharacterized protein n=1 Tax=Lophiostoma macrostomum CBS 122681 TaxID=1314788 RepID=A0A6A6TJX5_9PLEO|nr:hypothetical protein K491DRAFT_203660 [Lophiostoma macrostomum CBS 122681]